jgi:hypothetical protein
VNDGPVFELVPFENRDLIEIIHERPRGCKTSDTAAYNDCMIAKPVGHDVSSLR